SQDPPVPTVGGLDPRLARHRGRTGTAEAGTRERRRAGGIAVYRRLDLHAGVPYTRIALDARSCGHYLTSTLRGCSSVWLERRPVTPEAAGSSPVTPAIFLQSRPRANVPAF